MFLWRKAIGYRKWDIFIFCIIFASRYEEIFTFKLGISFFLTFVIPVFLFSLCLLSFTKCKFLYHSFVLWTAVTRASASVELLSVLDFSLDCLLAATKKVFYEKLFKFYSSRRFVNNETNASSRSTLQPACSRNFLQGWIEISISSRCDIFFICEKVLNFKT